MPLSKTASFLNLPTTVVIPSFMFLSSLGCGLVGSSCTNMYSGGAEGNPLMLTFFDYFSMASFTPAGSQFFVVSTNTDSV